MSNATDNLIEAEKMIRGTITNFDDQKKSLQICHWLFDFNTIEKGFKIKCYSRNFPDICFCVDRLGHGDCESKKVRTFFFCIGNSKGPIFRPIKLDAPYLKRESAKNITYILPSESKKLDLEILKIHIFESYNLLLNKLNLVSNISSPSSSLKQYQDRHLNNVYLPTKEDFESAYRALTRPGEAISVDSVLDQLEIKVRERGLSLKSNWRMITEENIEIWSKRR